MKKLVLFIVTLLVCISPAFADNSWSEGADINGDGIVDYKDFAIMAKYWLASDANAPDITWVYINDDGSGMKDPNGNPINEGGFTGEMSKYETTNAQYCEYLNAALVSGDIYVSDNIVYGANGSHSGTDFVDQIYFYTSAYYSDSQITYSGGVFGVRSRNGYYMGNHPVVEVSWYGATAFASYYGWRLPTEWEWQAVADYDGSYTYGCGTTIDQSKANYGYANPLGLSDYPYTSPVGYYPAYGYGMCDMAGNVFEWTSSLYKPAYSNRILRGGSWNSYYDYYCTVSNRSDYYPFLTYNYYGIRVCR